MHGHKRKGIENEMLDYNMSEKFGLDWIKYDCKRMGYLIAIMGAEIKKHNKSMK